MPDLAFEVLDVAPARGAAAPLLVFAMQVTDVDSAPRPIHCVLLHCQVRIEPARRRYDAAEQRRLRDLFGPPGEWQRSLRPLLWTHAVAHVGPFTRAARLELPVPCTGDFSAAAGRYLHALTAGDVLVSLLFSGTVFFDAGDGSLQVAPISWSRDAEYRLPVAAWREAMDQLFPNSGWLCVRRELLDQLEAYKRRCAAVSFDEALERLLAEHAAQVLP